MTPEVNKIIHADALEGLKQLPDECVDMIMTSPPYWSLRSYESDGQIGIEDDFLEYINRLIDVFTEAKRVLKDTGTAFINIADTYGGSGHGYINNYKKHKQRYTFQDGINKTENLVNTAFNKSMLMLPQRFSIAMVDSGWKCRNVIIWNKPNQIPQSVTDRFTNDFEYIFFFTKRNKYNFTQQFEPYDKPLDRWGGDTLQADGASEWSQATGQKAYRNRNLRPNPEGRNMRAVWSINTRGEKEKHYATYPQELVARCIRSGCPEGGTVLDPFMGSGTTAVVARKLNRNYIGFDLNPQYCKLAERKLRRELGLFK